MDLFSSPIGLTVEALQDAGREVYIRGFSADGRSALVVDNDNERVSVAALSVCAGLGRWECSTAHLAAYGDVYADRFPRRA